MENGEISSAQEIENVIRARYFGRKYRIIKTECPPGTKFSGVTISAACFVLEGKCRFIFDDNIIDIGAASSACLPEGDYDFEVLSESGVKYIIILELPDPTCGEKTGVGVK